MCDWSWIVILVLATMAVVLVNECVRGKGMIRVFSKQGLVTSDDAAAAANPDSSWGISCFWKNKQGLLLGLRR